MKHINALNQVAMFKARMRNVALSLNDIFMLRKLWKRAEHRAKRLAVYFDRNMAYGNRYAKPHPNNVNEFKFQGVANGR